MFPKEKVKKMSLGINGPDPTPAIQKSHHANDGGAGNLGYFQQQKKQEEDEKEQSDVFELSSSEEKDDLLMVDLESIGDKIKNFWFKAKNSFKEEKSEEL